MSSIASYSGSLSRFSLIVLAGLLPFFLIPGGSIVVPQGKMLIATLLIGVAGIGWCIAVLFGSMRVPRHYIVALAALLPIAYVVSAVIAGWPASALVSGLGVHDTVVSAALWFAALMIAAAVFTDSTKGIVWTLRAFLLGSVALILLQSARLAFPDALSFGVLTNAASTAVGTWHDLGITLGLSTILSLLLLQTPVAETTIWRVILTATAIASFLFLLVVNMSDISYAFAGVAAVIAVYAWFRPSEGTRKMWHVGLWVALAIVSLALAYFSNTIHDYLPTPLQVTAIEVRPSWEGTLAIGQSALSESRTLFFGSGPNSFNQSWALHKPLSVNTTDFWAFDFNAGVGVLPTAFVTLGIVGLVAWLLISLGFLAAIRRMLRRPQSGESRIAASLAAAVLFLFVFHVMYAPGATVSMLLFVLLGLFVATSLTAPRNPLEFQSNTEAPSASRIDMIGAGITAVLLVAVCGLSAQALASDIIVNKSIISFSANRDVGEASGNISRALSIWPSNDRAHRAAVELGILSLAQQMQNAKDPTSQQKLQTTLSEAIQHGMTAVSIDGADYQNWLTLAQLYQELAGAGVEGAYEQSKQAYTTARAENPTNPIPVFRMAQLEALRGNRDEAIKLLGEVIQLKQNFAAAYYLGSQLYAQNQQYQEAAQAAAIAVQLVPQDPLGWYNLGLILYAGQANADAAAAFSEAIKLQPDYSNAIFMFALAQAHLGNNDAALAAMSRVGELNPGDTQVQKIIENIKAKKDPLLGLQTGT